MAKLQLRDEILAAKESIQRKLDSINPNSKQGMGTQLKAEAFDKLCTAVEDEKVPAKK